MLRTLWSFFYTSCVKAEDDFVVQMKKLVVTVALFATPMTAFNTIATFAFALGEAANVTEKTLAWTRGASTLVLTLCIVNAWAQMKRKHDVATKLVRSCYLSLMLCVLSFIISNVQSHYCTVIMAIATLCIITRMDEVVAVSLCILLMLINAYNLSIGAETGSYIGASPDDVSLSFTQRTFEEFGLVFTGVLVLAAVRRQRSEFETTLRRNALAVTTTRDIAQHLVSYDTGGAKVVLDEYEEHGDHDDALCGLLREIVANLDAYRPYLPSYLHQRDGDGGDDKDCGVPIENGDCSTDSQNQIAGLSVCITSIQRLSLASRSSNGIQCASVSPDPTTPTPLAQIHGDVAPVKQQLTLGILHIRRILFAYETAATNCTLACIAFHAHEIMDHIHTAAHATAAVVHGYFGDAVQLSWNTARRVAQHEVQAATFLTRCRALISP
eukprot:PhM_4_TR1300/c1_g3_i2/m.105352